MAAERARGKEGARFSNPYLSTNRGISQRMQIIKDNGLRGRASYYVNWQFGIAAI
jgi:hypothetical protein